jgi:hypothetical protein
MQDIQPAKWQIIALAPGITAHQPLPQLATACGRHAV